MRPLCTPTDACFEVYESHGSPQEGITADLYFSIKTIINDLRKRRLFCLLSMIVSPACAAGDDKIRWTNNRDLHFVELQEQHDKND